MRAPITSAALIAAMMISVAAAAQPAGGTPPAAAVPVTGWSATGGYETFEFRDISRNIQPPDASPIIWRGEGPVMTGGDLRQTARRARRGVARRDLAAGVPELAAQTRVIVLFWPDFAGRRVHCHQINQI